MQLECYQSGQAITRRLIQSFQTYTPPASNRISWQNMHTLCTKGSGERRAAFITRLYQHGICMFCIMLCNVFAMWFELSVDLVNDYCFLNMYFVKGKTAIFYFWSSPYGCWFFFFFFISSNIVHSHTPIHVNLLANQRIATKGDMLKEL